MLIQLSLACSYTSSLYKTMYSTWMGQGFPQVNTIWKWELEPQQLRLAKGIKVRTKSPILVPFHQTCLVGPWEGMFEANWWCPPLPSTLPSLGYSDACLYIQCLHERSDMQQTLLHFLYIAVTVIQGFPILFSIIASGSLGHVDVHSTLVRLTCHHKSMRMEQHSVF